jgi:hypothetical protein
MPSLSKELNLLRKNDPTLTEFSVKDRHDCMQQYFHRLGRALKRNTHVSSLQLCIGTSWMTRLELEISSIRASPVLAFLRSSNSLRKVVLYGDAEDEVIGSFLESLAANPNIEELRVEMCASPPALRILESATCTFKSLCVQVEDRHQSAVVTSVMKAHRTLEQLTLLFVSFGLDGELNVIESVLDHPTLHSLNIARALQSPDDIDIDYTHIVDATSALLESTKKLDSLTIDFYFDKSMAERFLQALRRNESLTKLTFHDAVFDDEAIPIFVEYMMERKVTKGFSELSFTGVNFFETGFCFPGNLMAQCLNSPSGASVKVLSVDTFALFDGLWSGLNATEMNKSRMLQCIKLPIVQAETGNDEINAALSKSEGDMIRLVPDLLYLRELWLGPAPNDVDALVRAIRENSSLHTVRFNPVNPVLDPFDEWEDDEILLHAFGARNANLLALLGRPNDDVASTTESPISRLVPMLFSVAKQTPRAAANYMLAGLLSLKVDKSSTRRTLQNTLPQVTKKPCV